jgi:hypothetical protein
MSNALSHDETVSTPVVPVPASPPVALFLKAEAMLALGVALAAYGYLGFSWWLFAALILAPDLSAIGYAFGVRAGSWAYDLAHTYVAPAAPAGLGLVLHEPLPMALAAIWAAHIAGDRVVGYGLKFASGWKDTHLSRLESSPRAR